LDKTENKIYTQVTKIVKE